MADRFVNLPDISTIQPHRLIKYRVSEDRFSAEVLLPGLWYTDFDRKIGGKLSLWAIAKLNESLRWQGMMHGLGYYPELCHGTNHTMFVASQACEISQKFHDIHFDAFYGKKFPLRALMTISQFGTSSFTNLIELYEESTGDRIATLMTKIVYVSNTNRKPAPFPAEYKTKIDNYLKTIQIRTIDKVGLPVIPLNAYRYRTKALHSDCDLNHHVNQSIYMRWCADAASEAAVSGYFSHFKKPIELYPLKYIEVHYIGEALAGEAVTINTWEDKDNPKLVHFAIIRKERTIYLCQLECHDGRPVEISAHLDSKL